MIEVPEYVGQRRGGPLREGQRTGYLNAGLPNCRHDGLVRRVLKLDANQQKLPRLKGKTKIAAVHNDLTVAQKAFLIGIGVAGEQDEVQGPYVMGLQLGQEHLEHVGMEEHVPGVIEFTLAENIIAFFHRGKQLGVFLFQNLALFAPLLAQGGQADGRQDKEDQLGNGEDTDVNFGVEIVVLIEYRVRAGEQ